jgi:predicted enzyme related to lactoylglutathione lyase
MWFRVADIEATFQSLLKLGAQVIYAPDPVSSPGEILAMVSDPDGNQIGLINLLE